AEVDVSIRPGWFYHPEENSAVKPAEELFELYKKAVGGNATLLLNVPPNNEGLIDPVDVKELKKLGKMINKLKAENLLAASSMTFSSSKQSVNIDALMDSSLESKYWSPTESDEHPFIQFMFKKEKLCNTLILGEAIQKGQFIEDV